MQVVGEADDKVKSSDVDELLSPKKSREREGLT